MRGLLTGLSAGTLATLLIAPTGPSLASEESLRIPTAYLSRTEHEAQAPHVKGDLLAEWEASGVVDLSPLPPPGTGWVPQDTRLLYGTLQVGQRSHLVAVGPRDGDRALLGVDLDGDLSLRGEGEVVEKKGRPGRHEGRAVLRWKFGRKTLGTLGLDVTFRRLARSADAVLVLPDGAHPLELTSTPPAGTRAITAPGSVAYATAPTPQGPVPLAFARDEGDRLIVLTDANRNGAFGEAGENYPAPMRARDPGVVFWQLEAVSLGSLTAGIAYRELDPRSEVSYTMRSLGARRGVVLRGGESYLLHLLDADFDGTYTSAGDWWWFGRAQSLTKFTRLVTDSMVEVEQPFHADAPWRLISVDAEGNAVLVRDETAPPPDEYLHRRTERVNRTRYFPFFAQDPQFVQKRGIDPSRPKCAAAVRWYHDVGLDETLRRAKAQGKPVLVDFEADWCTICKRWDFHVYSDREVAALLPRFVLLKINVDFNFTEDLKRFGGTRPPYLVFLDEEGRPLLELPAVDDQGAPTGAKVPGLMYFQRPQDFVETLKAALAAWAARKGR